MKSEQVEKIREILNGIFECDFKAKMSTEDSVSMSYDYGKLKINLNQAYNKSKDVIEQFADKLNINIDPKSIFMYVKDGAFNINIAKIKFGEEKYVEKKSIIRYSDVADVEKWIRIIVPKMLKENDGTVYTLPIGRINGEKRDRIIKAKLSWEEGFEPNSSKFVDENGYGIVVGLIDDYDDSQIGETCLIEDENDKSAAKWVVDEFNDIADGKRVEDIFKQFNEGKKIMENNECCDLKIELCTCNDYFQENTNSAIAETLRKLADKIESGKEITGNILDGNGNVCGKVEKSVCESTEKDDEKNFINPIKEILSKEFEGNVKFAFENTHGELEFKIDVWLKEPNSYDLEEKIEQELGVKCMVEYWRFNEHGEQDEDGNVISVFIDFIFDEDED